MSNILQNAKRALSFAHLVGLGRPKPKASQSPGPDTPAAPAKDVPALPPVPRGVPNLNSPCNITSVDGAESLKLGLGVPTCYVLSADAPGPLVDLWVFALVLRGFTLRTLVPGRLYAIAPDRDFVELGELGKSLPEGVQLGVMTPGADAQACLGPGDGRPNGLRSVDLWGEKSAARVARAVDDGQIRVVPVGPAHVRLFGPSAVLRRFMVEHAGASDRTLGPFTEDQARREDSSLRGGNQAIAF